MGTIQIQIYFKCRSGLEACRRHLFNLFPYICTFLGESLPLPLQFISIGFAVPDKNEKIWEDY
jgi:hypothetical protein